MPSNTRRTLDAPRIRVICGVLLLAAALAGCADEPSNLTVVVLPQGPGGPERAKEVSCPKVEPVCLRLDSISPSAFAPVPEEAICTQVYGGPATARVTGRLQGALVDAHFSLRNGCQIARWERLAWLVGEPPGVTGVRQDR